MTAIPALFPGMDPDDALPDATKLADLLALPDL